MRGLNDIHLLQKIKRDNKAAFTEVVNRYSDILFRFIHRRTDNFEDSQDIVQEIFTSLWKNRDRIIIKDSLYPYLFQSAKYKVIDLLITKQKEIKQSSEYSINKHICYNTEEELLAKELADLIKKHVDKMPNSMKKAFTLSRYEAMSIKDIAGQLSLSEQTVKNNISLAISKLRVIFK